MNKMFSYNGTPLPELPANSMAYNMILYCPSKGFYRTVSSSVPFYRRVATSGTKSILSSASASGYLDYDPTTKSWTDEVNTDIIITAVSGWAYWFLDTFTFVWSNADIVDANDSSIVAYEGTEPVPIAGVPNILDFGWTDGGKGDELETTALKLPQLPSEGWTLCIFFRLVAETPSNGSVRVDWYKGDDIVSTETPSTGDVISEFYPDVSTLGTYTYHAVITHTVDAYSESAETVTIQVQVVEFDLDNFDPNVGDDTGTITPGVVVKPDVPFFVPWLFQFGMALMLNAVGYPSLNAAAVAAVMSVAETAEASPDVQRSSLYLGMEAGLRLKINHFRLKQATVSSVIGLGGIST